VNDCGAVLDSLKMNILEVPSLNSNLKALRQATKAREEEIAIDFEGGSQNLGETGCCKVPTQNLDQAVLT
jgi:cell fate regulator YaaT (PSP1 superfamily)